MRAFGLLFALVLSLTSCSADVGGHGKWGPLAVLDEDDASEVLMALGGTGRVVIDDGCVSLQAGEGGREETLVWRSGQVSWDAEAEEIVFQDFRHGKLRLADGDRITVGGMHGYGYSDPGDPPKDHQWLAAPAESCPSRGWNVHSVTPEKD